MERMGSGDATESGRPHPPGMSIRRDRRFGDSAQFVGLAQYAVVALPASQMRGVSP